MKTTLDEPEKLVRTLRSGYLYPFVPAAVSFLTSVGFAAGHRLPPALGFLVSGVVYLPVAVFQYQQNKQICEKAIHDYLKWVDDQKG
jgi:hypothetical protein